MHIYTLCPNSLQSFRKLCAVVEKKLCWQSFQYYFQYSNGQNWKFKKRDYVPSKNNGSSIDGSLTNVFPWKIYLLLCTVIFVTLTHKNVKNNKQNCDMRIKYHRIILYLSMLVSQWPWSTFQSECPTNQMLLKFQSVNCSVMPFATDARNISSSNQPFMAQWPSAISFPPNLKEYLLPVT